MIVGFNHNITYKGVGFHVQTEDSGVKSPQLVTLLYHGGTIIASQKTVYADIIKVDNLTQVVEDLAKEQHKGMLRRLTQGEFDEKIVALGIPLEGAIVAATVVDEPAAVKEPGEPSQSAAEAPLPEPEPADADTVIETAVAVEEVPAATIVEEPVIDKFRESKQRTRPAEPTLDDLIYAYLTGADEC